MVLAEAAVEDFLRGINATIFAYGQTGTGKTYSMYGSEQALLPLVHAGRMQATLNPQDRREGREGQIGTRPSPCHI